MKQKDGCSRNGCSREICLYRPFRVILQAGRVEFLPSLQTSMLLERSRLGGTHTSVQFFSMYLLCIACCLRPHNFSCSDSGFDPTPSWPASPRPSQNVLGLACFQYRSAHTLHLLNLPSQRLPASPIHPSGFISSRRLSFADLAPSWSECGLTTNAAAARRADD